MKLTYVTNARIPSRCADSLQIVWMCHAFTNKGYEVELFCPFVFKTKANFSTKIIKDYYKINLTYNTKRFFVLDNVLVPKLSRYFSKYITFLLQLFLFCLFFLPSILFNKANIYYCRYPLAIFILAFLRIFCIARNKKIIADKHEFPQDKISRLLYAWTLKRIDGVVVNSSYLKELYYSLGISSENILVAPNGVDLNRFAHSVDKGMARSKLRISENATVIVYSGSFSQWKGVNVLIESFSFLPREHLLFLVGGEKNDLFLAETLTKRFNLNNIVMTGYVKPDIVPLYLSAADVVVLPNSAKDKRSYFTSPLKLFEYMACQRPIVASNLPSIRDILKDGESAILIEPDNPRAIAERIEEILRDANLTKKIVTGAYRKVQQYTWDKRTEKIKEFISPILKLKTYV